MRYIQGYLAVAFGLFRNFWGETSRSVSREEHSCVMGGRIGE